AGNVSVNKSTATTTVTTTTTPEPTTTTVTTTTQYEVPFVTDNTNVDSPIKDTDTTVTVDPANKTEFDIKPSQAEKTPTNSVNVDITVGLKNFDSKNEFFNYADLVIDMSNMPEGSIITGVDAASAIIADGSGAKVVIDPENPYIVHLMNVNTQALSENDILFTLHVQVPETAKAGEYSVSFGNGSVIYRITKEDPLTITPVSSDNIDLSVKAPVVITDAKITDKEIVNVSMSSAGLEHSYYYSYQSSLVDINGIIASGDIKITWSNGDVTYEKAVDLTELLYVSDDARPSKMYDGKNFVYLADVMLKSEDYKDYADGAKIGEFSVLIGQKGDINLDHSVATLDATVALKENAAKQFGGSILSDIVKNAQLGENSEFYTNDMFADFAQFLGDVNGSKNIETLDATYILKFNAAKQFGGPDWDQEAEWNKLIG
ncbi:MAG: hypothetical protein Q4F95_16220, partial [Oscillospiraceae bacterium]|nr:hypothetical protein [Oscillospiraceae bacterium]